MAKRTRITIQTESLLIVRGGTSLHTWCPQCAAEADFIPIEGVGIVSNLSPPELRGWIESEDLHHSTAADGSLLICFNSLLRRLPQNP